jgi:Protein of unknown function (DUF3800)
VLVLIDESGDPGFRVAQGSSSHFVVAMVVFVDYVEAEMASARIAALRLALRVKPEFKFAKSADIVRRAFFSGICECRFLVRAIIVEKVAVQSHQLRTVTDSFYNYFLRMLLEHDGGRLRGARVKVDGSGDRVFRNELSAYLRRHQREGQIEKFSFVDSQKDNLIQLADMCAGAILRAVRTDRRRDGAWLDILTRNGQIENLWTFR